MGIRHQDLNLRYQAVCMIEAATVLAVGSGDKTILLENPIIRDAFNLPYIPGTSLTGVMRHLLEGEQVDEIKPLKELFGFQERNKENKEEGVGSRIILSSAYLFKDDKVADGLETALALEPEFATLLKLPLRDHVRINDKGVADKDGYGKFESELLPKGVRFVFEIELWGTDEDQDNWNDILDSIKHPTFRIGGGTRKGFGQLKVINCWQRVLNLKSKEDFDLYLNKTSQITIPSDISFKEYENSSKGKSNATKFIHYKLDLVSRDFFLFDGQFEMDDKTIKALKLGQKRTDMTPKMEQILTWTGNHPSVSSSKWLLPATSIKGAIAHRVAFHYNKKVGNKIITEEGPLLKEIENFIQSNANASLTEDKTKELKVKIGTYRQLLDTKNSSKNFVGEQNIAVKTLFGEALDYKNKDKGQRGKVLFSDVYIDRENGTEKILNHVSIDRFTGGALETALFSEKVVGSKAPYTLEIWVEKSALEDEDIKYAFEQTLKDLAKEQLPLGGGTMRGHGMMKGSVLKQNESL